jgi:hypothetical protein
MQEGVAIMTLRIRGEGNHQLMGKMHPALLGVERCILVPLDSGPASPPGAPAPDRRGPQKQAIQTEDDLAEGVHPRSREDEGPYGEFLVDGPGSSFVSTTGRRPGCLARAVSPQRSEFAVEHRGDWKLGEEQRKHESPGRRHLEAELTRLTS